MLNSGEWHFDTEILMQFHEAGLRIVEKPIPTYYGDEICYVNGMAYAFNCLKSALKYRLHKARMLYVPKYDVNMDHYIYRKADPYSSHAQIIRWIEQERPEEVLEVGTATGYLTAEMEKLGCKVTGVEQDPEMAEIARQYCHKLLVGDIETLNLEDLGRYNAVILGDVLERVRNPIDVLQKVSRLLKPGGKVLMPLPNVANIWIRLKSLLGRFNYSRVGLLDESNLRSFTLQTGRQLATDSGLDIIGVNATPIPLPLLLPATRKGKSLSFLHLLNWGLTKLRKTLFGYQFILICRPKE
jgi:protein-L-isoaspartate O-methyltransferase